MISIIIPTYNSGKNLVKTLASVYKNNFKNFEVIITDDGSSDNTRELIRDYPVRYLFLEANNGAGFARNSGARLAKGDILLFLDADGEIEENLLHNVNKQFETPGYDAISGVFAKEPKIDNTFLLFASTLGYYNFSKTDFTFSGHLGAVRRKVFDELGGFDERYRGATVEDHDFSQRLIAAGYRGKTDITMIAYHNHHFTFRSLSRRFFLYGLLKTPLILQYKNNQNVRNQKQKYLVNNFYIFSYSLILSLLPAIIAAFYLKSGIVLVIWLLLYILVKKEYLSSLRRKHPQIFLLLIITDIVVLAGCFIGASKYYYAKRVVKSHN